MEGLASQFSLGDVEGREPGCSGSTYGISSEIASRIACELASGDAGQAPCKLPDERFLVHTDLLPPIHDRTTIFGYQVQGESTSAIASSTRNEEETFSLSSSSPSASHDDLVTEQPSPQNLHLSRTDYTYSFQETSFSRRLHRYCLEHTFRLFIHPATDPQTIFRVFRLVSCIVDQSKMRPYFEGLLQSSTGEPLEIPSLPFYTIGRAGTHYARRDGAGNLGFPANMRRPKRILGQLLLSRSGAADQDQEKSYAEFLRSRGYGGVWLDSYDVEGYLAERGIVLDSLSSLVGVQATRGCPPHLEPKACSSSMTIAEDQVGWVDINTRLCFDVQRFIECMSNPLPAQLLKTLPDRVLDLLRNVIILGRAPGFRKSDVDAAIDYAMC